MKRIYKTAMGIEVCDIVTTSYSTGPYEVDIISGPSIYSHFPGDIFVHEPMIHLVCHGVREYSHVGTSWLNEIRLLDDGRYRLAGCDELFVEKPANRPVLPMDLFESFPAMPETYTFQDGVDYAQDGEVWKCEKCDLDFNMKEARFRLRRCPRCGWPICDALHVAASLLGKEVMI